MKIFLKNEKGIALFLVLWVLALLSVIVGEFCHAMRTRVNITRNFKEETVAYYIARAGINIAAKELISLKSKPRAKDTDEKEEKKDDEIIWRQNGYTGPVPFGDGFFKIHIMSENGKININQAGEKLLKIMLSGLEIDEKQKSVIVDSILDWRDEDNLRRLNGAENRYYQNLSEPYTAKNGDFDSLEELLLVKGITPEIFKNIKDLITIFPKNPKNPKNPENPENQIKIKKNKKPSPKKASSKAKVSAGIKKMPPTMTRININAAPAKVFAVLPLMTDDIISRIMEYRKEKEFTSLSQFRDIVGDEIYDAVSGFITLQNSVIYEITSLGTISGSATRRVVQAVIKTDNRLKTGYGIIRWYDNLDLALY